MARLSVLPLRIQGQHAAELRRADAFLQEDIRFGLRRRVEQASEGILIIGSSL